MAADAPAMRRGEDFLGRNVGVAGDAVPGGRGAAFPFVAVGKTDGQVGAGAGIFQRVKTLAVQPVGPLAQHGVVLLPCRHRAILIDARRRKDRIRQFCYRDVLRNIGKNLLRPGRARIGDDVPVGVEIDDLLQRRLIGDRIGLAGARHLCRVLARQQHRVVADDGQPRGVGGERLRHALIEPAGGAIETLVVAVAIARQRDLLIRQERRHDSRAGLVGMFGNPAHQRQRDRGRGQQQVLPRLQPQADLDRDFGEAVEFHGIDRGGNVALMCGHDSLWPNVMSRPRSLRPARIRPRRAKRPRSAIAQESFLRNPTSLMFRNATMPSTEPANSAGRLLRPLAVG